MTFVCEDNDENAVVTHVYPVEKGVSPIATLSCWSLMFLTSTMFKQVLESGFLREKITF